MVNDERQREDEAEINLAIEYDTKRQEMSKKVDELERENEELLERLDHARKNNDYNLEALTIQNKHSLTELMDIDNEMHQIMEECLQEDQVITADYHLNKITILHYLFMIYIFPISNVKS